jgi:hypothetical protein
MYIDDKTTSARRKSKGQSEKERPFIVGISVIASGHQPGKQAITFSGRRTKEVSGMPVVEMYLPFSSRVQRLFVNVVHLANGVSVHGRGCCWRMRERNEGLGKQWWSRRERKI